MLNVSGLWTWLEGELLAIAKNLSNRCTVADKLQSCNVKGGKASDWCLILWRSDSLKTETAFIVLDGSVLGWCTCYSVEGNKASL